ncbi:Oidioi.mRNA.OKI2018_I69.chr2.g8022.t1.cds [Oikopleura dioica]|uniref:Oidioi.mRNA.OKI2018_I69.chr2.g8022.t1.cds n=1 Tax=Oikopleura dioica TaxID=34765 RepID=A0ABN7TEJ7_OIKDI|nr:Oidioi.mRNA.OKI2018_I69.chr2.g8022.t1.cds [Oikopleura dioica]
MSRRTEMPPDQSRYSKKTLIGNWNEERQEIYAKDMPKVSTNKDDFSQHEPERYHQSYRTKYGHHLAYQKMTASTGNMFISGFPARKPDYLVTTGTDQPTTDYREKKKTGLTEDFGIKPERFSHKRMNIAARNKSTAIYPYDKQ